MLVLGLVVGLVVGVWAASTRWGFLLFGVVLVGAVLAGRRTSGRSDDEDPFVAPALAGGMALLAGAAFFVLPGITAEEVELDEGVGIDAAMAADVGHAVPDALVQRPADARTSGAEWHERADLALRMGDYAEFQRISNIVTSGAGVTRLGLHDGQRRKRWRRAREEVEADLVQTSYRSAVTRGVRARQEATAAGYWLVIPELAGLGAGMNRAMDKRRIKPVRVRLGLSTEPVDGWLSQHVLALEPEVRWCWRHGGPHEVTVRVGATMSVYAGKGGRAPECLAKALEGSKLPKPVEDRGITLRILRDAVGGR